ncbi:uncharacterized protein LOC126154581 [Schistocerca cancellata]|uniref:uncharacterized protein LOC126154581 n=1 Tax=Schistocerca cancellata TaxID=274614 RepID=UPI002118F78E|nr:uncharacterized protein LOC126154581 [Schistocerca cancellata]XP_049772114.1 uncharacterized protein LOC126154581 [Schistocerca cancellata]
MEARAMLALVAAVSSAANLASANLALAGPYTIDMLELGACDDGEYPGILVNISQTVDEETNETTYKGGITLYYDMFADDFEMEVTTYKWGSTGGWNFDYRLQFSKPFEYLKTNLPNVFESTFEKIGIKEKPVSPGTYYINGLMPRGIRLKHFAMLPYGKYKAYLKSVKDGEKVICVMTIGKVNEVGYI